MNAFNAYIVRSEQLFLWTVYLKIAKLFLTHIEKPVDTHNRKTVQKAWLSQFFFKKYWMKNSGRIEAYFEHTLKSSHFYYMTSAIKNVHFLTICWTFLKKKNLIFGKLKGFWKNLDFLKNLDFWKNFQLFWKNFRFSEKFILYTLYFEGYEKCISRMVRQHLYGEWCKCNCRKPAASHLRECTRYTMLPTQYCKTRSLGAPPGLDF